VKDLWNHHKQIKSEAPKTKNQKYLNIQENLEQTNKQMKNNGTTKLQKDNDSKEKLTQERPVKIYNEGEDRS